MNGLWNEIFILIRTMQGWVCFGHRRAERAVDLMERLTELAIEESSSFDR